MEYTAILNCFKAVSHLCKAYKLIWPAHLFTCSCILIKEKRYYNTRTVLCFNATAYKVFIPFKFNISVATRIVIDFIGFMDRKGFVLYRYFLH